MCSVKSEGKEDEGRGRTAGGWGRSERSMGGVPRVLAGNEENCSFPDYYTCTSTTSLRGKEGNRTAFNTADGGDEGP